MRAIRIREPGDPDVLEVVERPAPTPGPGEVRIHVAAMGVNRADALQRRGVYPAPPGVAPDVPGLEVAGTIDAVGPNAEGRVGDRVMSLVAGGGYAEQVVVHGREAIPVPAGWSMPEAAAALESYLTAFDALFARGEARPGERVLVHAVGSGVGIAVVQLARAAGLTTYGTSRTPAKLDRAVALGLHHAVAVGAALPEVDVIVDLVGGPGVDASLRALAPRGRLVVVGLLAGLSATIPLGLLLSRRLRVEGTVLRSRPIEEKIALAQAFRARGLPLLGDARPVVDTVLPATQAAEAHRRMEADASFGRIVLEWG
ncbi:MAG: NAD(P)H-quinone oxidoreductase [Pseudomonadota bacterium]|nr:NAD(P)H-quinone oxidoreductase [Pseudomonadota bacterium]